MSDSDGENSNRHEDPTTEFPQQTLDNRFPLGDLTNNQQVYEEDLDDASMEGNPGSEAEDEGEEPGEEAADEEDQEDEAEGEGEGEEVRNNIDNIA